MLVFACALGAVFNRNKKSSLLPPVRWIHLNNPVTAQSLRRLAGTYGRYHCPYESLLFQCVSNLSCGFSGEGKHRSLQAHTSGIY